MGFTLIKHFLERMNQFMMNTQCNSCKEPTKFPIGFWGGINNTRGCLYDCKNENCPVKQTANTNAEKKRKQQQQIIQTNHNNDVDVTYSDIEYQSFLLH